ncbi:hypothetical protein [Chryseobacterium indicum]|nr:hypothetical protein [Chryseobacterium sp. PS-8]
MRGEIKVDPRVDSNKNGYLNISSRGKTTSIRFIDDDTISVKGG